MSNKDDRTPEAQEVNKEPTVAEAVEKAPTQTTEDQPKEQTISEVVKAEETTASKTPDSIPYSRFKEVNDAKKGLEEELERLTTELAEKSSTPAEVKADLKQIADEFNLDSNVLDKIASVIETRALERVEEAVRPITQREKEAQQNAAFEKMYTAALEKNPDIEGVVNKEVIKQLAFNPANANKTMSQIISDTYGHVVAGKEAPKTMETTTPRGGGEASDKIDFKRAQEDSEYFAQIKANPDLHQKYNEQVLKEVSRHI